MYGFLNINKPKGITSFDVIRKLRKITGIKKMGHLGTLDPLAEGVLVIALNEATKLIEFLMNANKEYTAEMVLGATSDTYDADGEIHNVSNRKPSLDELKDVINGFVGEIDQIPPAYSAVKIEGKRAYDLARKGETLELKSRKVHVYSIEIVSYDYPAVTIKVTCGSGTYIRSLINDVGEKLGTGAYMDSLLRTKVGEFTIDGTFTLEKIEKEGIEKALISVETVIEMAGLNKIVLDYEEYKKLGYGQFIKRDNLPNAIEIFAAFFDNKLIGIVERVGREKECLLKFRKKLNID